MAPCDVTATAVVFVAPADVVVQVCRCGAGGDRALGYRLKLAVVVIVRGRRGDAGRILPEGFKDAVVVVSGKGVVQAGGSKHLCGGRQQQGRQANNNDSQGQAASTQTRAAPSSYSPHKYGCTAALGTAALARIRPPLRALNPTPLYHKLMVMISKFGGVGLLRAEIAHFQCFGTP